jgi:predicted dehydrogenase/threonine dehydrogenase-like Zn-dependent dehydrogenase
VKQVLQDRSGTTVVRDVPAPPCEPTSLLVQNSYSVISSGTERARVELSRKSLLGKARERPDLVREVIARARRDGIRATRESVKRRLAEETSVGYSSAGIVLEVGEAVSGFSPGDRVACAGGGHANHAEVVSVPPNLCAKVPDGVGLDVAAMTTIAAIALHGIRLADVRVGDRVAVIGCGLVGQIACRLLQAAGAEVFALDVDAARVEQAVAGGAHHGVVVGGPLSAEENVRSLTGRVGVDEVLISAAASTSDPLVLACAIARDRGMIVLIGAVPIEAPRQLFYDKELVFRVSRSYGPGRYDLDYEERGLDYPIGYVRWTEQRNMAAVLDLQARRELDLRDLIDQVFPVDDAARAYARLTGTGGAPPRGALVLAYDGSVGLADTGADLVVVSTPTAADGAERSAGSAPVRIGLIGPGRFASNVLVPAFVAGGARLELVGGGTGPSAESASRNGGFARVAQSAEDVIDDDHVDAVVIATRHGLHAELAIRALRAGKHVFCEKPLAVTLEELESVLAAAASSRGVLAVGFNRRFSPHLVRMRSFIRVAEGRLVANYRISAGVFPNDHWVHDLEQGAGRAIGEGCHFVDSIAFLAESPIETVYAVGYGFSGAPLQAYDNLVISLRLQDGSVGTITYVADGDARLPKERLEVFAGPRTAILDDYRSLELFGPRGKQEETTRSTDKGHNAEVAAFLGAVIAGRPPVPLAEVANVSAATLAIVESLRTGRPVRIAEPA